MIIEAESWKMDLKLELDRFEKFINEEGIFSREFDYHLERFFFISAFIIRKLIESRKIPDKIQGKQYSVVMYERKPHTEKIDNTNYIYQQEFYNLRDKKYEKLVIKEITNIIIHSYTMNVRHDTEGLKGIYVTTKDRKDKGLYYLDYNDFKSIILKCINNQEL